MNNINNKAISIISVLAIITLFITLFNAVFGLILAIVFTINGLLYLYITDKYNKDQTLVDKHWSGLKRRRIIATLLIAALIGLALVIFIRISTPQDTWLCQDGKWVKHGQPNSAQPTEICK